MYYLFVYLFTERSLFIFGQQYLLFFYVILLINLTICDLQLIIIKLLSN